MGAAGTFNGFLWAEQPLSSEGLTKESKNWAPEEEAAGQVLHCGSERVDVRDEEGATVVQYHIFVPESVF